VPAGVIESEENDAVAPGSGRFEQFGKEWLVDPIDRYQTVSPLMGATNAVT
jgi:hypothetical protein